MVTWQVHTYASLSSTQDYVKELCEEGLEEGIVIQCLEQRKGRGRHGRHWHSPIGNLYMSVLLRPDVPPAQAAQLSFVAALAVSKAVDEVMADKHTKTLKWPNDILVNGKKLAGIIIEKEGEGYALGIGVNIMAPPEGAIGINEITWDIQVPIHPFRDRVLEKLNEIYALWRNSGFAKIRAMWLESAHGLGQPIKAQKGDGMIEGIFKDLSDAGAVQIETADGAIIDINAGDVYFS